MNIKALKPSFALCGFAAALSLGVFGNLVQAAPAANALPTGGNVVAGNASINTSGNTMNINQSSQRAVINWNSFDVGKNATVNFNQPNAQAATLNYVNSASKSMINGAVNANGQVIFVNNNGVVFGKNAEVNVGGMVATTMNVDANKFMNGDSSLTFTGNGSGKVVNKGHITGNNADSYIALMAPTVKNTGVITATMSGKNAIALVAGEKVSLTFAGSQLVSVSVDASTINALISNKLLIQTNGGQVIIAANAAQDLIGSTIKNTGQISASGISKVGGTVKLVADTVVQAGTVEANSDTSSAGNVTISGNNVTLTSASKTTATGANNGGQILIGKTSANTAQSQVNAQLVNIEQGALVDASSTQNGNGGDISIWSQIATNVAGIFKSNGGVISGSGGNIDTSSAGKVTYGKGLVVDTTAPKGKTGNWLTDPLAIIVDSTAAGIISNALQTTNVTLDASAAACGAIGTCSSSATALIHFVSGADIFSSNTNTALNLIATGGTITVDSNITAGQVTAVAQAININGSLNTNGGSNSSIYLAGAAINILGNINSNGGTGSNSSSSLNGANTTTGANRRNGQNGLIADINAYTSNGGSITILSTGDINISANSYISANGQNAGTINIVSTNGNVNINGIVDAIGKNGSAGPIAIAGFNQTNVIGGLISSEGLSVGGVINLGQINNLGNGSTLAPPATAPPALTTFVNNAVNGNTSITSSNITLDGQTGINAPNGSIVVFGDQIQVSNSSISAANGTIAIGREAYSHGAIASLVVVANSTLNAQKVETSGNLLGTGNISVVAGEWLLDPTNVTIAASTTTGGVTATSSNYASNIAAFAAQSGVATINTADIENAINAGTSVNIVASGSITLSSNLVFNVAAANNTPTLTLDNRSGSKQSIATAAGISSITDNTTASGSGVNIKMLSAGGYINFPDTNGATGFSLSIKGDLTIDNTFAVGGTTSWFITAANAPTYASNTTSGINFGYYQTISAANITMNGVSSAGANQTAGVYIGAGTGTSIAATNGNINLTGVMSGTTAFTQSVFGVRVDGNATASLGAININGSLSSTSSVGSLSNGFYSLANNTFSAQQINITGSSTGSGYGIFTQAPTGASFIVNSSANYSNGGTAITLTGNSSAGPGIYLTSSAVTNQANGGDVKFISNSSIYQSGTTTLAKNTSNQSQTVLYDTRTGNQNSSISEGPLSITTTGASNTVNYAVLTNGAPITIGGARTISGFIEYDNTCLGCSVTGFSGTLPAASATSTLNAASSTSSLTTSVGVTVSGNQTAGAYIEVGGINNSSSNAAVALGASNLTVNSGATFDGNGNAINIIGIKNTANIGTTGIASTGTIADNASGGNISFVSNGIINQTGAVNVAANASASPSAITYDTTSGNSLSTITAGALTITGGVSGSTSSINYVEKAAGATITAGAITVPGSITLDNTANGTITPSQFATATVTSGHGVDIEGVLTAKLDITISGVDNSASNNGVYVNKAISAGRNLSITGVDYTIGSAHSGGAYVLANLSSSQIVSGGTLYLMGNAPNTGVGGGNGSNGLLLDTVTITSGKATITSGVITTTIAGGDINIFGRIGTISNGTAWGIWNTGTPTVNAYGANANIGSSALPINGYDTFQGGNFGTITSTIYNGIGGNVNIYANGYTQGASISGTINADAAVYIFGNTVNSGNGVDLTASVNAAKLTILGTTTSTSGSPVNVTTGAIKIYSTAGTSVNGTPSSQCAPNCITYASGGNAISVTGNYTGTLPANTGAVTGINFTSNITDNANGGSISFVSNNKINETGTIAMAANQSGANASVTYDTTSGTKASSITTSTLSVTAGSTYDINYIEKTTGASITPGAVSVPGYILMDDTYLSGVSGGITAANAWTNATTLAAGITIANNLTATKGIVISGVVGASSSTANPGYSAVSITGGTLSTTGTFAAGTDAIAITGTMPVANTSASVYAVSIAGSSTAITNNSTGGNINIKAIDGNYNDPVTVTSSSSSGAIYVSAIGPSAAVVSASGTTFTQNSNSGIYITSSNSGNVSPPKILNNGTGPVVIGAGVYLNAGDGTGGQITGVSTTNTITSANGPVYLYSGNIAGSTNLQYLSSKLSTLTFNDAQFDVAYKPGNVAATSLPDIGYNTDYVPSANLNPTTSSTYGPIVQYRASINYNVLLSSAASFTKVYGTADPVTTAGTISTAGTLDYLLNSKVVSSGNTGISGGNAVISLSGTGYGFSDSSISISNLINSISGTRTAGAAYENVSGTPYAYTLASSIRGLTVSVATGSSQPGTASSVGLTITAAPLTITADNAQTFIGVTPVLTGAYTVSGLVTSVDGITTGDTVSTMTPVLKSVISASGTFTGNPVSTSTYSNISAGVGFSSAATVSANTGFNGTSNYAITYYSGTLVVVPNQSLIVKAVNGTSTYGTYNNSTNLLSNNLSFTAAYCTNCASGASSYTIKTLTVYGPSSIPSNILGVTPGDYVAVENPSSPTTGGVYQFSVTTGSLSYSTGHALNVGAYSVTPSSASFVSGHGYTNDANGPSYYGAGTQTVTPLTLTFSTGPTLTYNGGTAITNVAMTPGNKVSGDSLTVAVNGILTSPNATVASVGAPATATGGYSLTSASLTGSDAANYVFAPVASGTNATVLPAAIIVTTSNVVKTFDNTSATTGANVSSLPSPVLVGGNLYFNSASSSQDALSTIAGAYTDVNAGTGNKIVTPSNVTFSGATQATNYSVTYVNNTTSTINPAVITINGTSTYNGTTSATNLTATGIGGAALNLSGGTATMNSANVGTNSITSVTGTLSITNGASSGTNPAALASNYTFVNPILGSVVVSPLDIYITASNATKTYDATSTAPTTTIGSTTIAPSPVLTLTSNALVGSDALSGGTFAYTNPNAGTGNKTVTVSGVSVVNGSNNDSANYTIHYVNNTTSTINPAVITINGTGTYNGSTSATNLTATGVNGQTLILSGGTGTMNSANAGTNALTGVTGTLSLANGTGANPGLAANYTIVNPTLGNVTVSPLAITVTATSAVKTYDATLAVPTTTSGTATIAPTPVLTLSSNALVAGDSLSGGTFAYTDPNVAGSPAKTVTVANVSVMHSGVNESANYTISYVNNTTSTINAAPLTVSGLTAASGAIYNGGTSIGVTGTPTLSGAIAGAPVTVSGSVTTGTLSSPNAGTNIPVNFSPANLSGLTLSNPNYYIAGAAPITATVSPAPLTISIVGNPSSTYNGTTTTSNLTSANYQVNGLVSGQSIAINQPNANYNSANVASANSLSALISSANATPGSNTLLSNYVLPATATGAGTITPAPLTMTANNVTTFIGLAPSLTGAYTLSGLVGTDTAATAITNASVATISSYSAGSTPAGTYSGMLVPSATSSNYTLSYVPGNLTVAPAGALVIQIASGNNTVVYGTYNTSNINSVGAAIPASAVNASYCSNCALGNTNPVVINLAITAPTGGSNLWTASDSFAAQGAYNFTINATVPAGSYSAGNNLKVGSYTLTPGNVTTVAGYQTNYDATKPPIYINGTLNVTPLTLTLSAGPTVTYNGTNTLNNVPLPLSSSNMLAGDALTATGSGTIGSPNAGTTSYAITSALLSGPDAANYIFSASAAGMSGSGGSGSTSATVTPAQIVVTASNAVKTYDGNTVTPNITVGLSQVAPAPVLVSGTLYTNVTTGLLDTLATVTTAYADPNVHTIAGASTTNKVLNVTAATVTNGSVDATGNYTISYVNNTTSTINPASVSATAGAGAGITYNGSTTIPGSSLTLTGVGGASLSLAGGATATIASPNAGTQAITGITGSLTGGVAGTTSDPSNYTLANPSGTAVVNPAAITISASNTVKTYDATTATSGSAVTTTPTPTVVSGTLFTNVLTGAKDAISSLATAYADPNAGTGNKTVTVSNASITNNGANANSNYTITYANNTTSTINPAVLTVSGLTAPNMVYNGGTAISLSGTPTLSGIIPGGSVSIASGSVTAGTLASPNAASGIAVTPDLSGLVLSNSNYVISGVTAPITATVTPAPLTIGIINNPSSVYNGTTTTNVLTSSNYQVNGLVSGQSITISQPTANFNDPNVANANTLTAAITVANATPGSNTLLSNYILPISATGAGIMTKAPLTMTALPVTTFIGLAPDLSTPSYTLTGLLGTDTAASAISSPAVTVKNSAVTYTPISGSPSNVTYANSTAGAGSYAGALIPSATSANYNITPVAGNLIVAPAGAPVVTVGTNSVVYGTYNASNISSAGGAMPVSGVSVSYCSDCALGNASPTIKNMIVGAPTSGNTWTALDPYGNNPTYSFVISAASPAYSGSNNLKVGNYVMVPSALTLTSGTTNFGSGFASVGNTGTTVYNNGSLSVTPLTLTFATGPTTTYNGTNLINNAVLTPNNVPAGDGIAISGSGTLGGVNAGSQSYAITSALLTGPDAANYTFSPGAAGASGTGLSGSTSATVLPAAITVTASNTVKTYDASTAITGGSVSTLATPVLVSGALYTNSGTGLTDALATVTGAFADANAGNGNKTVNVTGATVLNGSTSAANNYIITYINNTTSTINPAPVTISVPAGVTYNGSNTVAGSALTITGVGGQTLSLNGAATVASPNAGTEAVTGLSGSLIAGTSGTPGNPANYTLVNPSGSVLVNPAPISISATNAVKTFDNTTATPSNTTGAGTVAPTPIVVSGTLFVNSLTGLQDTLTGVSTVYADANVKNIDNTTNKTLNVSNASILNGTTNAVSNYAITYVNNTSSTINPFQLTVSGLTTPSTVAYSGLSTVSVSGTPSLTPVSGSLPSAVTISSGAVTSGTVPNPNVQYANGVLAGPTAQTVTPNLSSLHLSSTNYAIVGTTSPLSTTITPAQLTISGLSGVNKVYDTTTAAAVTGTPVLAGIPANGATVGLAGSVTSGTFAQPHVLNNVAIAPNLSSLTLTGPNAGNYAITGLTTPIAANITPATITLSGTANYNGTNSPTASITVAGLNGQTLSYTGSVVLNGSNAGSQTVNSLSGSLSNGTGQSGDYTLIAPAGSITILPAPITVTTANVIKTYDATAIAPTTTVGTSIVAASPVLISGTIYGSDQLTGIGGSYTNVNVGSGNRTVIPANAVLYSGANNVSANYVITYVNNTTSTINPASLYVSGISANNKTYNANTAATISGTPTISGSTFGQSVTLSGAVSSGTFASPGAANGIAVTPDISSLSINNPNFVLVGMAAPLTANITPAPLTISGLIAAAKAYDGTTAATISGTPALAGNLFGQSVSLSGLINSGVFAQANPGNAIAISVILSGLSLNNPNFFISGLTAALFADITALPVKQSQTELPLMTLNQVTAVNNNASAAASATALAPNGLPIQPAFLYKPEPIYVRDVSAPATQNILVLQPPSSGSLRFPVPDKTVQDLINISGNGFTGSMTAGATPGAVKLLLLPDNSTVEATLVSGEPLPDGVRFNPSNKTFYIEKLSDVNLPIEVKLTLKNQSQTLAEKVILVTK